MNDLTSSAESRVYDDIARSETLAAADPVDEYADEVAQDESYARTQAYWASPDGVVRQLAEHRAEREKWGPIND